MTSNWKKLLSREGVDLVLISSIDVLFYEIIWEFTGKEEEAFFTHYHHKTFTHYINVDSIALGEYVLKRDFDSIEKIKGYYKQGKVLWAETERKTAGFRSGTDFTMTELLAALEEFRRDFYTINKVFSITPWLAIETWQQKYEKITARLLQKAKGKVDQEMLVSTLFRPWKPTAIVQMQDELSKGAPATELASKYQFLRSWSAIWYRIIDEKWVKDNAAAVVMPKKSYSSKEVKSLVRPDKEEEEYILFAPYIIFFKDWRDDLRRFFVYSWSSFFEKVASCLGIGCEDLGYLTFDEIEIALRDGEANKKMIEKRKAEPCVVTSEASQVKIKIIEGEEINRYEEVIGEVNQQEATIEIKGLVAQGGKIQGKVIVVHTYHDLKKVQEGVILVANTTHPNYLPGMQKAAAFITNEGGIISHAAIVAREMKKPCIVGTKVATQLLKDGDIVEVDADRGMVKKLQ